MKSLTNIVFKNNKNTQNTKKEKILSFISFLIVFIFLSAIMIIASVAIINRLKTTNESNQFIIWLIYINFIILFTKSILESLNTLYFSKDMKIFLRMPIKAKDILKAKFFNMIYSEYQMEFILLAIPMIVYGIMMKCGINFYIYSAIILVAIPIIPIMVSSLIVSVVMRILNFMKNKTALMYITIIISLGCLSLLSNIFGIMPNDFILIKPISNILLNYNGLEGLKNIIIYILENVLCYFIILNIISKIYLKGAIGVSANTNKEKKSSNELRLSDFKQKSVTKSYLLKEILLIIRTPIFLIECIIMPVTYIAILVLGIVVLKNMNSINYLIGNIFNASYGLAIAIVISLLFFMMNLSSIIAISKDSKSAKLVKYIPVSLNTQFHYKTVLGIIINTLPILCITTFIFIFTENIVNALLIFVSLEFVSFIYEKYKLLTDLKKPQIKWESEYTMMKQNTNVMYELFYTIFAGLIIIGIGFLIDNSIIFMCVIIIVCLIINILINKYIKTNEKHIFSKIY